MASNDLEVIKEIEEALGVQLPKVEELLFERGYVLDESNHVIALSLIRSGLINSTTVLPFIGKFKKLYRLNLSANHFKDYSFLNSLNQLRILDLSFNQIDNCSFLNNLKNIQKLDLHSNQISNCSCLENLGQLCWLDLRDNQISDISFLEKLDQLQAIKLNNNQIEDISAIKCLASLKELDLRENRIAKLPAWITDLPSDTIFSTYWKEDRINVGGNPLVSPPPEIISQGREATRAYYSSLENQNTIRLNEVKVLLVGDGMAGKTSLLKRLQGLDFDKKESQTHGINVLSLSSKELPGFEQLDECRLHFWDFSGQEIMHATHRFFMSNRSLYILILDSRTDSKKFHWLRHIEKYGGKSPLIVAMNKIDINPSYNIEQKSINEQFPWIANRFFRISCKNGEGLPDLVRSIASSIPETPQYGMEISKNWLEIRKRLQEAAESNNYITRKQFAVICQQYGVEDEISRITLLKLLNDLGTVLFFENLPLTDIYVLDPHWVTVGVYKIINSEKTKDGILRETDLEFILNEEKIRCDEYDPAREKVFTYTRVELSYLIQIMQEFKLCYLYSESEHLYILPNQLPKEPEQEPELHGENLLRFIMEYDFLPSSLFSRLIVRLKDDITKEKQQQWRYGMFLKNDDLGVQAIIRMEEQSSRIMITIKGGLHNKRRYLSIIRHSIAGLGFQELELREFIPLPDHPDTIVEYSTLLAYEQHGLTEYFNGKLATSFSVHDLLDSVISKEERIRDKNLGDIPPPVIASQGSEAVTTYIQSIGKDETVRLREAKVLLVGDGKAGKTSLLKRLQGLDFNENESQTHGITVLSLLSRELPDFKYAEDCRLHFWDFGGQEIMHASHRFFMTHRSLYILVLDTRDDDTSKSHWHWLRHIEKYGGNSSIIIAINKIDTNPYYNIQRKDINNRFPWIENRFHNISCKNKKGLPELIQSISDSVQEMPVYKIKISKSWLEIRKELEETTGENKYINRDQFIAICQKNGVKDEKSQFVLLKLLHDLGTVLFFEQIRLTDIYVLDPHWVTVGVYKIINSAKTKGGILHEDDLDFILKKEDIRADEYGPAQEKNFAYIVQEQEYLIRIMEEFELCYRYDKHQYILPNKLPKELEQEPKLNGSNLLGFVIEYDFLPSSLFSRLMVRLKDDIVDQRQQWRYGMLLKNSAFGVQATVKTQEDKNRITITIQGDFHHKRQYLSVIRHSLVAISSNVVDLKPNELVPLPGYLDAFAKYKDLLGHEQNNWAYYRDGELGEEFPVSELLDSVVSKTERNKEGITIMNNIQNNANQTQNVNQSNTQTNTQNQSVDLHNQFKEAQGLFRNLKDDILEEAEIEIEDEKEKKRVANELNKAEKALTEAEEAAAQGKEPDAATKSRLEGFFNSLADKSSRLGKALEFVDQNTQKVQKLARTYNSIAGNVGLPTVPPLLLGKERE